MILLLAAGCSSSTDEGASARPVVDRIVVANTTGDIYLIDPAGGERLDLAEAGTTGLQPVWSPDAQRIAWSQRDGGSFAIASASSDGTERAEAATPFSGYFGYWNPTSTHVGYLGNSPPGTGLVLDAGQGGRTQVVDSDTFYYFSWSPDGTRWVVHSGSGLHLMDADGVRQQIDLADGPFRAPIWAPDGSILLVIAHDGRNVVVRYDPDADSFEELVVVGDLANMVLDLSGRYLAIESVHFDGDAPNRGDAVQVALQTPQPAAEVLVYDLQADTLRTAFDGRTGGFWWSPDASALAMLVTEEGANPQFAQWLVWTPEGTFRTERFTPSRAFATSYIPFFDQFAQAVTPWSPDGTRFVYTGRDEAGRPGVFVQLAQPDTAPQRIAEDDAVAFWSPT